MPSNFSIIPKDFELNKDGRPVNASGKILQINNTGGVVYKNGNPVYNNNNIDQLPKRIRKNINILQHEKSGHSYIIIKNKNKNGIEIEKFVKLNKEQQPMKNGDNYIYLNKITGEAITGNGRKYTVNKLTGELSRNKNGYILENNNNNISFPQKVTPTSGSFFYHKGNAPKSNQVLTVFGPLPTLKKPGFKVKNKNI